jgi:hypothetical protein
LLQVGAAAAVPETPAAQSAANPMTRRFCVIFLILLLAAGGPPLSFGIKG